MRARAVHDRMAGLRREAEAICLALSDLKEHPQALSKAMDVARFVASAQAWGLAAVQELVAVAATAAEEAPDQEQHDAPGEA